MHRRATTKCANLVEADSSSLPLLNRRRDSCMTQSVAPHMESDALPEVANNAQHGPVVKPAVARLTAGLARLEERPGRRDSGERHSSMVDTSLGATVVLRKMTGAIAIRPYRSSDVPAVYEAAMESVQCVQPFMAWCHPHLTEAELHAWIETQVAAFQAKAAFEFAIVDADRYVGGCGLNKIDYEDRRANVAYWVRTSATGRGIASAAVRSVVRWAWENTELARLEVVVATSNLPSLRTAERAGAQREGVLRQRLFLHGVMHDAVMFSFVRESHQSR